MHPHMHFMACQDAQACELEHMHAFAPCMRCAHTRLRVAARPATSWVCPWVLHRCQAALMALTRLQVAVESPYNVSEIATDSQSCLRYDSSHGHQTARRRRFNAAASI